MTNEELINIAKLAWKNSVSDISSYGVGAALLATSGTVYIGANIEEASIPSLSDCAERVAFKNAMSHGEREFLKIAIVGGNKTNKMLDSDIEPCGVCLQYMLDFCENIEIITYRSGKIVSKKISDYLSNPYKFKEKL